MPLQIVQIWEKETPFLKNGSLEIAENVAYEKALVNIKLQDLKIHSTSIGKGSYGQVFLATHESGITVAVKKIDKNKLKEK